MLQPCKCIFPVRVSVFAVFGSLCQLRVVSSPASASESICMHENPSHLHRLSLSHRLRRHVRRQGQLFFRSFQSAARPNSGKVCMVEGPAFCKSVARPQSRVERNTVELVHLQDYTVPAKSCTELWSISFQSCYRPHMPECLARTRPQIVPFLFA